MLEHDLKKITRLTAILTQLQSKRILTANFLAKKFNVSTRTIYRDIKTLEQAGVPIIGENGKGFSLMDGYRIPPVMFTEIEALALITGNSIIAKQKDASFRKAFSTAIDKIKAVFRSAIKEDIVSVERNIFVGKNFKDTITSSCLMDLQMAIINNRLIHIRYSNQREERSSRNIEPYLLYHNDEDNWIIVAYCHKSEAFLSFRIDRIQDFKVLDQYFSPDSKSFKRHIQKKYLSNQ